MRRSRVDLRRIRRRPRTLETKQRIRGLRRPCLGLGANAENSSRFTENSAAPSDTRNQPANPRPTTSLPRPRRQCEEFESIYGEFVGALGHSNPISESGARRDLASAPAPIPTNRVDLRRIRRRPRTLETKQRIRGLRRPCLGLGANAENSSRFTENSLGSISISQNTSKQSPVGKQPRSRRQCDELE